MQSVVLARVSVNPNRDGGCDVSTVCGGTERACVVEAFHEMTWKTAYVCTNPIRNETYLTTHTRDNGSKTAKERRYKHS